MKKNRFFAALCCAAAVFAACEKNEPKSEEQKDNNPPMENLDTLVTMEYMLTVLSNDESIGIVSGSGKYDIGETVKITAKPADGAEFVSWSDTSSAELEREIILTSDSTITAIFRASVDLGLSVKWATCNVGATSPEEYGNYYAWGETTPKDSYPWETYKYGTYNYDEDYSKMTKYNTSDGKITLEAVDDAATANWGSAWRMPTDDEWTELRENCEWIWTDSYQTTGVAGYWVTGKNGNTIFLPAAGYRFLDNLRGAGDGGYYWSSSCGTIRPIYAWHALFRSDDVNGFYYYRCSGLSVRPVCK